MRRIAEVRRVEGHPTLRWWWQGLLMLALGLVAASALAAPQVTLLPLPAGASQGNAVGVSERGALAGNSSAGGASPMRATLWPRGGGVPVTLPSLAPQGSGSAMDLNERGWVVGDSTSASGDAHATLWRRGSAGWRAVDLGTQGIGRYSTAVAINRTGAIVGYSTAVATDNNPRATLWQAGQVIDLGTLGGSFSGAYGINQAGMVVGASATEGNLATHAVRWQAGHIEDLGPGYAYKVNDAGHAVGTSDTNVATRWLPDGTRRSLGTVGGSSGSAAAINNAGQIAGWSTIAGDTLFHATAWLDEVPVDLNDYLTEADRAAGWYLAYATGMNEAGVVTGAAFRTGTAEMRAFVVTLPAALPRSP